MARLVDDSDGEFPDLAELLKGPNCNQVHVNKPITSQTRSTAVVQSKNGLRELKNCSHDSVVKPHCTPTRSSIHALPQHLKGAKFKRRVLTRATDNPLLRPLSTMSPNQQPSENIGSKLNNMSKSSARTTQVSDSEDGVCTKQGRGIYTRRDSFSASDKEGSLSSEGMSSFIVSDGVSVSEDDNSLPEPQLPRSSRRLVRGRRKSSDSPDLKMGHLTNSVDNIGLFISNRKHEQRETSRLERSGPGQNQSRGPYKNISSKIDIKPHPPIDAAFELAEGDNSSQPPPGRISTKDCKTSAFTTPPASPGLKSRKLKSPAKKFPSIPDTPHRPSMDSFWSQEVINEWNDEFSPRKPLTIMALDGSRTSGGASLPLPRELSQNNGKLKRELKKQFDEKRHKIAVSFLAELDAALTGNKVGELSASTGGIQVVWSKKLNTTAGRANWKRETVKASEQGNIPKYQHHATIELAEKVIDDENRLLNVIAHEFCHLATFMISNIKTNPHGKEFKEWAAKCSSRFGARGIEVTTKHSYAIDYRYIWECENCGTEFKRHSKSINPSRQKCGKCKASLVQTHPKPRVVTGEKKISDYQMFVKDNMQRIRAENPGSPQKEVMGIIGRQYQERKLLKQADLPLQKTADDLFNGIASSIVDQAVDVDSVARRLEFFDLTKG